MHIRRLNWAGIALESNGRRLLIDPLSSDERLPAFLGKALFPMLPIPDWTEEAPVDALVTHRHSDHYDPSAIKRALGPGGRVFCPVEMVQEIEKDGLNARGVAIWETVRPLGSVDVEITAVPAVDWRGDPQVSWVVHDGRHRIFHGGDTIWHGSWWSIAQRFSGFDIAFLPVNGVVARVPGTSPSNLPATLTPQYAAVAARLLGAKKLCPIHFGQFNDQETYREHPDVLGALDSSASHENVSLLLLAPNEEVDL